MLVHNLYRKGKLFYAIAFFALLGVVYFSCIHRPQIPHQGLNFQGTRRQLTGDLSRQSEKSDTLVVYLHGLGGTILEPYKHPSPKRSYASAAFSLTNPILQFAAIDFGTPGVWVNGKDFDDITCGIEALLAQTSAKQIILAGSSMGGSAALTYAAKAPDEIRAKIIGIVAIYPVGNFAALYEQSSAPEVKLSMDLAFGGPVEKFRSKYMENSLLPNLSKVQRQTKFYIISAATDAVCPRQLQVLLSNELEKSGYKCQLETVQSTHLKAPPVESFCRGLDFVLSHR
jgi:pimeloyl-ACP methyl ester carboxylesterase